MISAIELKKYIVGAGILDIVISKLRHGKKPYLIILLKVDKGSEVGFHYTILPLNLAVRLWVKSSGESPLDAKKIA